jgi:hypothetical protein
LFVWFKRMFRKKQFFHLKVKFCHKIFRPSKKHKFVYFVVFTDFFIFPLKSDKVKNIMKKYTQFRKTFRTFYGF